MDWCKMSKKEKQNFAMNMGFITSSCFFIGMLILLMMPRGQLFLMLAHTPEIGWFFGVLTMLILFKFPIFIGVLIMGGKDNE